MLVLVWYGVRRYDTTNSHFLLFVCFRFWKISVRVLSGWFVSRALACRWSISSFWSSWSRLCVIAGTPISEDAYKQVSPFLDVHEGVISIVAFDSDHCVQVRETRWQRRQIKIVRRVRLFGSVLVGTFLSFAVVDTRYFNNNSTSSSNLLDLA